MKVLIQSFIKKGNKNEKTSFFWSTNHINIFLRNGKAQPFSAVKQLLQ